MRSVQQQGCRVWVVGQQACAVTVEELSQEDDEYTDRPRWEDDADIMLLLRQRWVCVWLGFLSMLVLILVLVLLWEWWLLLVMRLVLECLMLLLVLLLWVIMRLLLLLALLLLGGLLLPEMTITLMLKLDGLV